MSETLVRQKPRKLSPNDLLEETLAKYEKALRLSSPTELAGEVKVPADIYAALMTGRPEILRIIMQPRQLNLEECQQMYNLLGVLIETNHLLAEHSREVGHTVDIWTQAFKQLHSVGARIQRLANYSRASDTEDSEED